MAEAAGVVAAAGVEAPSAAAADAPKLFFLKPTLPPNPIGFAAKGLAVGLPAVPASVLLLVLELLLLLLLAWLDAAGEEALPNVAETTAAGAEGAAEAGGAALLASLLVIVMSGAEALADAADDDDAAADVEEAAAAAAAEEALVRPPVISGVHTPRKGKCTDAALIRAAVTASAAGGASIDAPPPAPPPAAPLDAGLREVFTAWCCKDDEPAAPLAQVAMLYALDAPPSPKELPGTPVCALNR